MKGCKLETLRETWEPELLEKYEDWELSNIKACQSDKKIKGRIYDIFNLGVDLANKETDEYLKKFFNFLEKETGFKYHVDLLSMKNKIDEMNNEDYMEEKHGTQRKN